MQYADEAKLALLNWILMHQADGTVIGTEVHFLDGRYRADIVTASRKRLCAIEIKGPKDDLRRLARQLNGYRQSFLEVYIATTAGHLDEARALIPRSVGILIVSRNEIELLRQSQIRRRFTKEESLSWLKTDDLRQLLRGKSIQRELLKDIIELRSAVKRLFTVEQLSTLALESVHKRLGRRFEAFLRERGKSINYDDLQMLQLPDRVV